MAIQHMVLEYLLLDILPKKYSGKINEIAKSHGLQVTKIGYVKNGNNGQVTSKNLPLKINAYKHF